MLGFGSLRPLRIDRAGATLVGATAMIVFGVLTPTQAVAAVDFHTLALLFGMMIVVAHLRLAGFFGWLAARMLAWARTPTGLLAAVTVLSGALSALFVNDAVCLLLTPMVHESTLALGLNPVPFLLAVAMGANVGSVAAIVGNPQNMLVASLSHIRYAPFAAALAPVAVAGLELTMLALRLPARPLRAPAGSAARAAGPAARPRAAREDPDRGHPAAGARPARFAAGVRGRHGRAQQPRERRAGRAAAQGLDRASPHRDTRGSRSPWRARWPATSRSWARSPTSS